MTAADDSQLQAALAKYANLPGKQSATWNTAYSIITYIPHVQPLLDYHLRGMDSLFCASAFKVFVLTAYLYYAERRKLPNQPSEKGYASPLAAALAEPLTVSDHTHDSQVFGYEFEGYPTGVTGTTSASAILVAMIAYSDNTATDIAMKRVGVDNVRNFMYKTAGLKSPAVRIPDSTKAFYDYLSSPGEHHLINDKETMVCTAGLFAEFYEKALTQYNNPYFKNEETRRLYKWFLSTSGAIPQGIPEDMTCYMKGGMANYAGQHALAASGQVTVPYKAGDNGTLNVQFSMLYNWSDLNGVDNWGTGVQAWTASFKEVFAALRAYVLQLT
jgi:beta-lactamase class A